MKKILGTAIVAIILIGLIGGTCYAFGTDYGMWWLGIVLWLGSSCITFLLILSIRWMLE